MAAGGSGVSESEDKPEPDQSFGTWRWLALFVGASPQRGMGACICRGAANLSVQHLLLRSEWPTCRHVH